jgi:uncharacterized protein (DUF3084 family)
MMIGILAVALTVGLVVGTVALLAANSSSRWIPALLDLQKRPLDRKLEPAETRAAQGERGTSMNPPNLTAAQRERTEAAEELARQEAALAERERIVERSAADAERRLAEASAQIAAREALLATREAELQQQASELADRERLVDEREREFTRAGPVPRTRAGGVGAVEADWWDKQLGPPAFGEGAKQ